MVAFRGSDEVIVAAVVTPSSRWELAVMVVAEPARGIKLAVRPDIPLEPPVPLAAAVMEPSAATVILEFV